MKGILCISLFLSVALICYANGDSTISIEQTRTNPRNEGLTELDRFNNALVASKPEVENEKTKKFDWFNLSFSSLIEIGPGLQAASINLESAEISYLKSISPVSFTFNWFERVLVHWIYEGNKWDKEIYKFSFFPQTIGLTFSSQNDDIVFGISYIPLQIRFNDFQLGCGLEWRSIGVAAISPSTLSIIFPFTYLISF